MSDDLKAGTAQRDAEAHTEPGDTCQGCVFFLATPIYRAATSMGRCRRMPGGLPIEAANWCGEFKRVDPSRLQ